MRPVVVASLLVNGEAQNIIAPAHRDIRAEAGQLLSKTHRSGDNGGVWRQNDWKMTRRKQGTRIREIVAGLSVHKKNLGNVVLPRAIASAK